MSVSQKVNDIVYDIPRLIASSSIVPTVVIRIPRMSVVLVAFAACILLNRKRACLLENARRIIVNGLMKTRS